MSVAPRRRTGAATSVDRVTYEEDTLANFYATELRVAVGLTARMGGASVVSGGCVHGARVVVILEAFDPVVTWSVFSEGALLALCSCSGVLGNGRSAFTGVVMEYPQMQEALRRSSTCRHALALLRAYDTLASDIGAVNYDSFFSSLPLLLGPLDGDDNGGMTEATITYYVTQAGLRKNVPIYVVCYDGMWAAVAIRPSSNKFKLTTCCQLSCKSRPWGCIHAKAVNKITRVDAESEAVRAEMAREDELPLGPAGILNSEDPPVGAPAAAGRASAAAPSATPTKPRQRRRARNLFPCSTEVRLCDQYSSALQLLRSESQYRRLGKVHVESKCLVCDDSVRGHDVKTNTADLYTMRGRLEVVVETWTCANGHFVDYDGSEDGLFAVATETLYVRVFLDSVLGVCVIARSTMAAAAEYLPSVLRNIGAYEDGEFGQNRQRISDAVGEFTETLIIPEVAFDCRDCGAEEATGGRFKCVLGDGQILAVLQQYIMPMTRPGMDAPRADMVITYACAVRNATVRAVIRHRVRSGAVDSVAVTANEVLKFRPFEAAMSGAPPAPPPPPTEESRGLRAREEQEAALRWSVATLFHKFFYVRNLNSATGVIAAGATDEGPLSGVSDGGSGVNLATGDQSGGNAERSSGSASEYSSDALEQSAPESSVNESEGSDHQGEGVQEAQEHLAGEKREVATGVEELEIVTGVEELEMAPSARDQAVAPASPPATPPLVADGLQFLLSQPGGDDGAGNETMEGNDGAGNEVVNEDAKAGDEAMDGDDEEGNEAVEPELIRAAVPRTYDRWRTPVASVEPLAARRSLPNSDDPVAVDVADPSSPLTQRAVGAANEVVVEPLTGSLFALVQLDKIPLSFDDFELLLPYKWLNDEVINGMSTLMQWRNERTVATNPSAPTHYFFSTYFYTKLWHMNEYSYSIVQRWTKDFDVLNYDKIFFPINVANSHWILAVLDKSAGTISVYDSLGGRNKIVGESLKRWVLDEADFYDKQARQWTVLHPWCRQQENCDDCGVFAVQNMNFIARGRDLSTMMRSTAYYRRRMAAELLASSIGGEG